MVVNFRDVLRYRLQVEPNGLIMLYQKCAFINDFRVNPSMGRKDEWRAVGSILANLGTEGEIEWQRLSMADKTSWDPYEYADHLNDVLNERVPIIKCRELRESGLCTAICKQYNSPMDVFYEYAAQRQQGLQQGKSVRTVNYYRRKLERDCDKLFATGLSPGGIYHFGAPNGVGKTTIVLTQLFKNLISTAPVAKKVLILAPRHNLWDEFEAKKFFSQIPGLTTIRLAARDKLSKTLHCPHHSQIESGGKNAYPVAQLYCNKCPSKPKCEYFKRLEKTKTADIILGVHAHLNYPLVIKTVNPDLIIIDESLLSAYRDEIVFSDHDIAFTETIIKNSTIDGKNQSYLLDALNSVKKGQQPAGYTLQWTLQGQDKMVWKEIIKSLKAELKKRNYGRLLIYDLIYMAQYQVNLSKNGNTYSYIKTAILPADVPVILLDSTTTAKQYQRLLGRPVRSISVHPSVPIRHHVEVTQLLDSRYPRSSLYRKRVDELRKAACKLLLLMAMIVDGKQYNLITHKKVADKISSQNLINLIGGGLITYFGNVSGLNTLENADIVVIMGYQMLGYKNLIEQARIGFDTGWQYNDIVNQVTKAFNDASITHWDLLSFHDSAFAVESRIDRYSEPVVEYTREIVEQGDYIQALGRIRPFSPTKPSPGSGLIYRQLYILSNQPSGPIPVDRLVRRIDLGANVILPRTPEQRDTLLIITDMLMAGVKPNRITQTTVAKHSTNMKLNLNYETVKAHFRRIGKMRFINTAYALIESPGLKKWMLGVERETGCSFDDDCNDAFQERLIELIEQVKAGDPLVSSAAIVELNTLVFENKHSALIELANNPLFQDLDYPKRIAWFIKVLQQEIQAGDHIIGFDGFNSLAYIQALAEDDLLNDNDDELIPRYEEDHMW